MKYQIGDEVRVEFIGKIIGVELDCKGYLMYRIKKDDEDLFPIYYQEIFLHPLPTEKDL